MGKKIWYDSRTWFIIGYKGLLGGKIDMPSLENQGPGVKTGSRPNKASWWHYGRLDWNPCLVFFCFQSAHSAKLIYITL